ncbi:MAG: choice-of-anchor tandem repeat GloVer-containing protein [Candidatus Cybelea sp.]|jgi:uncharacterized repeat protein (TIGR03803 family)
MNIFPISRYPFSLIIAAVLLAGCVALPLDSAQGRPAQNDMQPPRERQSHALEERRKTSNYKVLYSFRGQPDDGARPYASLVDLGGMLYGTTELGGTFLHGVVFSVKRDGTENTLYKFTGPDGGHPVASLIDVKGTLYGTTERGGAEERGTVFSLTTAGVEQRLHEFLDKGRHGGHPAAPLLDVSGTLYGTTELGGSNFGGTVFSITTSGTEKELHDFNAATDGRNPVAPLIDVGGTLYGTTAAGGTFKSGTVFSITTSGTESVLYSFGSKGDGTHPDAGLIDVGGTLYGTTGSGGTSDKGTVFSITTSGAEKVVYSFAGGTDGSSPAASLIDVDGTLYGTTVGGGANSCGCGTVFSITTSGTETVLHSFAGRPDGAYPLAALLDIRGVLYGTTQHGGSSMRGQTPIGRGTVFALSP